VIKRVSCSGKRPMRAHWPYEVMQSGRQGVYRALIAPIDPGSCWLEMRGDAKAEWHGVAPARASSRQQAAPPSGKNAQRRGKADRQ